MDNARTCNHDETLAIAQGTYFDVMRRYFLTNAAAEGYEVIDMQRSLVRHYWTHRQRFDWPYEYHWNVLAHGLRDAISMAREPLPGMTRRPVSPEDLKPRLVRCDLQ